MEESTNYQDVTFRDRLATVDYKGKRKWVFPKMPKGKLYNYRRLVAYVLLLFFYAAPHIKIKGEPALFFNFIERRFEIFGSTFYPQDFHLLVFAFIAALVFIILFTVIYGRLFCGWVCPQTVFMEFLYRPIEYLIDGDRKQQIKLREQEWNGIKIIKRLVKHALFFAISFWTMATFLSYIIGYAEVRVLLKGWPWINFSGFMAFFIFTFLHYGVFSWFREQVCTLVCPYGRLQGVMLDNNSIIVAYDYKRGEPRGPKSKGDCINCFSCVDVCPTGIDVRDGTQLECINCTACIDACNSVMTRINKPKGLIRFASVNAISEGKSEKFNFRAIAYSAVLVILLGLITYFLINRGDVETTIIRAQGSMFQEYGEEKLSNLYNLQMINKTSIPVDAELKLLSHDGEIKIMGDPLSAEKGEVAKRMLLIVLDKKDVSSSKTKIEIGVYSKGELKESIISTFVGPNALDN